MFDFSNLELTLFCVCGLQAIYIWAQARTLAIIGNALINAHNIIKTFKMSSVCVDNNPPQALNPEDNSCEHAWRGSVTGTPNSWVCVHCDKNYEEVYGKR